MHGRRVVVIGASAGIGRSLAVQAVKAGAEVVLGARRQERLAEVVAEAGGGTARPVDLCDAASRQRFVADATTQLGAFDLVVLSAGWADLRPLAETGEEAWARTLATNLVGANQLLAAVLPALAPDGIVSVLSSESAARPRRGLVPYAASKAALEASLAGWRVEHPGVRISCVVVGATFPTGFGDDFDGDHLVSALDDWQRHGLMQEDVMAPDDVAGCLLDVYASALRRPGVGIDQLHLRSPSPVVGTGVPAFLSDIPPAPPPAEERP